MKNFFLFLLTLSSFTFPLTAQAKTFTYTEMCWYKGVKLTCSITDSKDSDGFLTSRNITGSLDGKVIKVDIRVDDKGMVIRDSDCQCSYQSSYGIAPAPTRVIQESGLPPGYIITAVTWNLWVRQITWD
jgi:hypothetical protein